MIDFKNKKISETAVVVEISGVLSASNRDYFFDCIGDMLKSGVKHVVIECHKLGYLNSSGVASLLVARRRASRKGCRIYLTHLNSHMAEVLEVMKLGRILSVFATTEHAVATFQNGYQFEHSRLEYQLNEYA